MHPPGGCRSQQTRQHVCCPLSHSAIHHTKHYLGPCHLLPEFEHTAHVLQGTFSGSCNLATAAQECQRTDFIVWRWHNLALRLTKGDHGVPYHILAHYTCWDDYQGCQLVGGESSTTTQIATKTKDWTPVMTQGNCLTSGHRLCHREITML